MSGIWHGGLFLLQSNERKAFWFGGKADAGGNPAYLCRADIFFLSAEMVFAQAAPRKRKNRAGCGGDDLAGIRALVSSDIASLFGGRVLAGRSAAFWGCYFSPFCVERKNEQCIFRMRGIAAVLVFAAALEAGVEMRCRAVSGGKAGRRVKKPKGAEGFKGAGQFLKEADRFNGAERFLKKAGSFNGAERFLKKAGSFNRAEKLFLAVILTMVFVQLARINLMPDYDSLHYGLRSHYILDAGHGIYEDLGNIHLVYTYSKGWEVLTFPLSGTITYGFQLCFNLWMAVLVVVLSGGLVFRISRRRTTGLFCGMLISLIPGIMNMGITAKSDLLTLVCQLCILWAAVEIFKTSQTEEKSGWFGIALGACLFSFALKPTSLVFSSLLALGCLGTLIISKEFGRLKRFSALTVLLMPAVPCAGALAGMWIRTWRMTGVLTTSVFTSIWEKLGFSVKWPYAFSSIPNEGMQMGVWESISFLLKRLLGVLFAPTGDDMFHVRLAWGSSIVFLGLAAWMFWGMGKEKEKRCGKVTDAKARSGKVTDAGSRNFPAAWLVLFL